MLGFEARTGLLRIETPLFTSSHGEVGIDLGGPAAESLKGVWRRSAKGYARTYKGLRCRLHLERRSASESRLKLDVSVGTARGVHIQGILGLVLPAASTAWTADPNMVHHYVHNSELGKPHGVKILTRKVSWAPPFVASKAVTVLYDAAKRRAVLIGALPDASSFTTIEPLTPTDGDGCGWKVSCDIRALLTPGAGFSTGAIILLTGADPLELLETYGDRWAEMCPPTRRPVRVGWNSWDYYSGSVQRADMDENINAAMAAFGGKVRTFAIDEGWESQWGAWTPNTKFPEGLADYCKRVRDAGGEPGIWTAPLCMGIYTPHARYHQDWFIRGADGQPIMDILAYGYIGYLDPTREDVCRWLTDLYGGLREEGFSYFKLDFLDFLFKAHAYHDPTVPRAQVLRRAVQVIRDAVGDDAYVMAPLHMEPLAGLVDAARVAGDIHTFWGHIRQNALSAAMHYWKHGRLWNNDIDFAITRCAELSTDPYRNRLYARRPIGESFWFAGPEASLEECRTWLNICYLSAGEMILSDALRKLSPKGIGMLRRVLPRLPSAARPLDLFSEESPPTRWRSATEGGWVMGYFNWSDYPRAVAVDSRDWGGGRAALKDFWSGRALRGRDPVLRLPPHHSRLISVTV